MVWSLDISCTIIMYVYIEPNHTLSVVPSLHNLRLFDEYAACLMRLGVSTYAIRRPS